jgi:hypothetical protein
MSIIKHITGAAVIPLRGRTLLPGLVKGSVLELPECSDIAILNLWGTANVASDLFRVVPRV